MWHVHGILSVWHCSIPLRVRNTRARTVSYRHACGPAYIDNGLLLYRTDLADTARIVVPRDEDLEYRILFEAHDTALSGHLGREKTYGSVSQHYWWPKLYNG